MAKFLNTTGVSYHLEELIKGTKDRLILISPYLQFLKGKEVKELYIRCEASTRQIKDAEEIINYWKDRQVD
jgi:hypothetical protein